MAYLTFTFAYLMLPIMCVSYLPHELFLNHDPIRNNIFGYGQYCGAGPDENLWEHLRPIDEFDQACQSHDNDYRMCYESLNKQLGFPVPKFVHQLMALRGLIPLGFIKSYVFGKFSDYLQCMHAADEKFIQAMEDRFLTNQLPTWWENLAIAPNKMEGIIGYNEVCTLGISSFGYCLLSSKSFFQIIILFFRLAVNSDLPYLLPTV